LAPKRKGRPLRSREHPLRVKNNLFAPRAESPLEQCACGFIARPMRREMYPVIGIAVAIDQPADRGEWQIEAIDGVSEEYRVPFPGFDGPQVVEFYKETFEVESGVPLT
jgi:hypothetical protein